MYISKLALINDLNALIRGWLAKLIHGDSVLSADEDVDQAMVVLGRLPSRKLLWAFDIHGLILTYEGGIFTFHFFLFRSVTFHIKCDKNIVSIDTGKKHLYSKR